ncbi:lipocalin-like domain-containing protein [Rhizobium sp. P38BS-XIX]|uniref:lipocalin-like domain-containing protein n=1 Tax=Rhizobium sp. P38BS-XIX TaxID=2726740 RepID=UPI001456D055|nr:lipocalin-like domain-containing protein [Rhizobium sp. P38BS-XIX]NLS01261.1 lipocalin-like domain-containing protein [Rhizobium sp. P38BS-XIX]
MSDREKLVGVWELVDATTITAEDGRRESSYGDGATGFIHYTATGRMMALITHGARERLEGDRQSSPDWQKARAYTTSIAYAGRYSIEGDRVVHHVDTSTYPNWVGTQLTRQFRFEDDRVFLRTLPQMQNGIMAVLELEWRRHD